MKPDSDNPPRVRPGYWFLPRQFGMGATPATWQGWATIVSFVVLVICVDRSIDDPADKACTALLLGVPFIVLVWLKTDGGWGWHWPWRF